MEWEPISYQNSETKQYYGIAFDMVNEIASRLGVKVQVFDLPMKRMLASLENGYLDLAVALYKNSERQEKFIYSDPYIRNESRIFVKKGREFPFKALDDLKGKLGVVPAGGSFGERFDSYARDHLDLYQLNRDFKQSYHKLILKERRDYYVSDYLDGMMSLRKLNLEGEIVPLDNPVDINKVHFVFSKKSTCVSHIEEINHIIQTLKEEGFVARLVSKYQTIN
ncbi:MAG: transporter substrate-binding domain-containing protein [Pseudomonadales bacterium]|nr:transporter substrate-binding domain-containing protein [Pseudomonadales bacterium]